jgi:hypothetical protein
MLSPPPDLDIKPALPAERLQRKLLPHQTRFLTAAWAARPAVPSVASRRAWATAHGLVPAAVHKFFWTRREMCVRHGGGAPPQNAYELALPDPPLVPDPEPEPGPRPADAMSLAERRGRRRMKTKMEEEPVRVKLEPLEDAGLDTRGGTHDGRDGTMWRADGGMEARSGAHIYSSPSRWGHPFSSLPPSPPPAYHSSPRPPSASSDLSMGYFSFYGDASSISRPSSSASHWSAYNDSLANTDSMSYGDGEHTILLPNTSLTPPRDIPRYHRQIRPSPPFASSPRFHPLRV